MLQTNVGVGLTAIGLLCVSQRGVYYR